MYIAGRLTHKHDFFKAKRVTVSPLALLVLSACGGGSSGSNSATNTTIVSGAVVKGPLQNAFVFLDLE